MPPHAPRSFWQRCRLWFRRVRITVWLLVLVVVCAGLYVTQIGLPGFLKHPLLEVLHERGVEMEYTRLRWHWFRGIVAENVRFRGASLTNGSDFSAREVELDVNLRALLRGEAQVDGVVLHRGQIAWAIADTHASPRTLHVEDIHARLRLLPADEWALDDFRARFLNAHLALSGTITNASAIRDWPGLSTPPSAASPAQRPSATVRDRARHFADLMEQMSFTTAPELRVFLTGDARDLQSFAMRLTLSAPEAATPWGQLQGGLMNVRLFAADTSAVSRAELRLEAASTRTPWADASRVAVDLKLNAVPGGEYLVAGDLALQAATLQTRHVSATNAQASASWIHSLTNPIPVSGRGEARAASVVTPWARSRNARLDVNFAATAAPPAPDPAWGWWTNLLAYQLAWAADAEDIESEKLVAARIDCAGSWQAPTLAVSNLHAALHQGELRLAARLDVPTREACFDVVSTFDVRAFDSLLTEKTRRWLGRFSWATPPHVRGRGAVMLPAWTNAQPDWRGEVRPTLRLAGEFAVTNGAYLGLQADWACSHVTYTNLLWHLPDLEVSRSDGRLRLEHRAHDGTRDYYWRIHSTLNPQAVRPLFSTNDQRGFDYFTFTTVPVVEGEVWGRFHAYDQMGGRGSVVASNFTFKGEPVAACVTELAYTNLELRFFEPRIWRGTQHLAAAGVTVDFNTRRVHFTNAFSTDVAEVVARAIGPKTARSLQPYHFAQPPTVRLEGTVPLRGSVGADLRAEIAGGPFSWWKFDVPQIRGTLLWHDQIVILTNVTAAFYGGQAHGWGVFDTAAEPGTDFQFDVVADEVNLRSLMADLLTRPDSRLEGDVRVALTVTAANSDDWQSWNGYGRARLRDGWIWEIPIFGVLSGPLDSLAPGLGNSRVTEGAAKFVITNGVIFSDDLEMRAPTMRLQYTGTVDLEGRVNASVQAKLFRDTWVVGRIISLALWPVSKILEYRVSGTLNQPKADPLYIPKLLLAPLRPFRTLRDLFSDEDVTQPSVPREPAEP